MSGRRGGEIREAKEVREHGRGRNTPVERERTQGEEQSGRNKRGCKWGRRERGSSKHPALLTGEPAGQIACETEALMVAGSSFFAPPSCPPLPPLPPPPGSSQRSNSANQSGPSAGTGGIAHSNLAQTPDLK